MPLFQVFHHDSEHDRLHSFSEDAFARWPLHYRRVAVVEAPELGAVFELTNHIHDNWTQGPAVTLLDSDPHRTRSTSVGDVILGPDDKVWGVAGIGFTDLDQLRRCYWCAKPVYDWGGDFLTGSACPACEAVRAETAQWASSLESSPDAAAEWAIDARMAEAADADKTSDR